MEAHPRWQRLGWLYLWCGLVACACSAGPTVAQELGSIPLGVAWLVSLNVVWPVMKTLPRQPLVWLLLAWPALLMLGWLWTTDPHQAKWDLASMRFAGVIFALLPVMRDRRKLVAALAVGFLLGNASQLALWAAHAAGHDLKPWNGRNPGWWTHPAEAGYILVAALGLHLPAAMMGQGRARWLAAGACVVTWLGMLATGARGAWLAAAALTAVVAAVAVVKGYWKWRSARWVLLVGVLGAVLVWMTLGDFVSRRLHEGFADARTAVVEHRYQSDTGGRIKLALMAWDMFKEKPLLGWGPGSYRQHAEAKLRAEGASEDDMLWWADKPRSAHNAWLNIMATLGVAGLALGLGIVWAALRGGFQGLGERMGTYAAGPGFALVGVLLTTPFDPVYVNSVPSAVLATLMAMCVVRRPSENRGRS